MLFQEFDSHLVLQTTLPIPHTLRAWAITILTAIHDCRFPPCCKLDLCSTGMLRGVDGKLGTDVLHYLTLQGEADSMSRKVEKYQHALRNIPDEQRSQR